MYQAGLVLEGGGMKGVYTAGVLDFFTEKGIDFSHIYGVSAGACHMCSYLSRQKGRALSVSVDYLDTRRYCSLESLLTSGDLFNVDFCYHLIPDYLYPYDYDTFEKYPGKAYSVVTNIETGQPEYLRVRDIRKDIDKIRASASLPLVARNVKIDGWWHQRCHSSGEIYSGRQPEEHLGHDQRGGIREKARICVTAGTHKTQIPEIS